MMGMVEREEDGCADTGRREAGWLEMGRKRLVVQTNIGRADIKRLAALHQEK